MPLDIHNPGLANVLAFLVLVVAIVGCFFGATISPVTFLILLAVLAFAVVLK